jgi:prepilin-type N-terminal cleavage/methylation domain-containing protein
MNCNKNSPGFTLIEILVAINISAVSILLVVSFLMFAQKYLRSLNFKYDKKWEYSCFYLSLSRILKNDAVIDFSVSGKNLYLITHEKDTINFQPGTVNLRNIYKIGNLEHISLEIINEGKPLASYSDGNTSIDGIKYNIYQGEFKFDEIIVNTSKDNSNYTFNYFVPAISGKKFKDMKNDDI